MNTATAMSILSTERRQEFLRDVQIREDAAAAVRRLLTRHGADDLMTMIGVD